MHKDATIDLYVSFAAHRSDNTIWTMTEYKKHVKSQAKLNAIATEDLTIHVRPRAITFKDSNSKLSDKTEKKPIHTEIIKKEDATQEKVRGIVTSAYELAYVNEEQEFSPEMYSVVKSQLTINPNAYVIPTERRERLKFLKGVNEIHLCSLRVGYVKDTSKNAAREYFITVSAELDEMYKPGGKMEAAFTVEMRGSMLQILTQLKYRHIFEDMKNGNFRLLNQLFNGWTLGSYKKMAPLGEVKIGRYPNAADPGVVPSAEMFTPNTNGASSSSNHFTYSKTQTNGEKAAAIMNRMMQLIDQRQELDAKLSSLEASETAKKNLYLRLIAANKKAFTENEKDLNAFN